MQQITVSIVCQFLIPSRSYLGKSYIFPRLHEQCSRVGHPCLNYSFMWGTVFLKHHIGADIKRSDYGKLKGRACCISYLISWEICSSQKLIHCSSLSVLNGIRSLPSRPGLLVLCLIIQAASRCDDISSVFRLRLTQQCLPINAVGSNTSNSWFVSLISRNMWKSWT